GPQALVALALAVSVVAAGAGQTVADRADARVRHAQALARQAAQRRAAAREFLVDRTAGVQASLRERARGVLDRDPVEFLASVDPADPAFLARQRVLFASLRQLRFASWSYALAAVPPYPPLPAERARYHRDVYDPLLTLRYALAGFDVRPVARSAIYTFVRRGKRWLIASDSDWIGKVGFDLVADPWDVGPIAVAHGTSSLVIGSPSDAAALPQLAAVADAAVARVVQVWPTGWSRRVVVVVSRDPQLLAALLAGSLRTERSIAAVAVPQYDVPQSLAEQTGQVPQRVGARIVINPAGFLVSDPFTFPLLVHETTHVATEAVTGAWAPRWLVEGFAEWVAFPTLDRGLSVEFVRSVQRNGPPQALPADSSWNTDDIAPQYDESWLACRYIAEQFGVDRLLALYRRLGPVASQTAAFGDVDSALPEVLGVTPDVFVAGWRSYVSGVVAQFP
ncbi:MAG TPA: hypothetical protein VNE21_03210, partial [Mycobacteriales bacterium]|nr:hypothetical protein [Mycobacteriales bacterium]